MNTRQSNLKECCGGFNPKHRKARGQKKRKKKKKKGGALFCESVCRMGNSKSSTLSKELLEDLKSNTKYSEAELCTWYQSFLKECPSGKISKEQFEGIYASFFPNADPTEYARHVFRSFDTNADGTLDFKEYIVALHLTSGGKTLQKLEWAFALYDVDGNGTISNNEILEIVRVLKPSSCIIMAVLYAFSINFSSRSASFPNRFTCLAQINIENGGILLQNLS